MDMVWNEPLDDEVCMEDDFDYTLQILNLAYVTDNKNHALTSFFSIVRTLSVSVELTKTQTIEK